MRWLLLLSGVCVWGFGLEVPPSPSTVPGVRIWPDPAFTHWPAIVYADELRNVAFSLPVRAPGVAGTIGWSGRPASPFTLPGDMDRISGLLALPPSPGDYRAAVTLDGREQAALPLRVVDAAKPWPLAGLRAGFPVDDRDVPVVLLDHRRDASQERKWIVFSAVQRVRPTGKAVFVGDPLAALGAAVSDGLDARVLIAGDERQPWHAQLAELARDMTAWAAHPAADAPRTLIWSPGNQALLANTWSSEEERFLGVVRTRCEALDAYPRLVLLLPPLPIEDRQPAMRAALERRDLLRRSASAQGWVVLDADRIAGPAEESFRVGERVYATGPVGEARARVAAALAAEIAK